MEKAEQGIIFIDEIDKIAKKRNSNQRDVSGESVQQGMLKLLEGSEVEVPVGANSKNAMVPLTTVNTRNILFICGGAFPDLEGIIKERLTKQSSIGFGADLKDKYDHDKTILEKVTVEDLRNFGMIPEFLGRLPIIFTLQGMNEDMLVKILKEPRNAILKQYQKLLALDEVKLEFEEDALTAIAKKAMEKDTGARALRAIIEEFMLDIMYEIPKDDNIGQVTITRAISKGPVAPSSRCGGSRWQACHKEKAGKNIRIRLHLIYWKKYMRCFIYGRRSPGKKRLPGEDPVPGLLGFPDPGIPEDVEVRLPEEKTCVQEGDFGLRVISADKEIVGDLSFEAYGYPAIPKCYALLDMDALNETGISTVQNYPALQLDGKES